MTVKVQVGPPQIAIHQGQTVLISEEDGQINWPSDKGLYFFDTRVVSNWAIYANGELSGGAILDLHLHDADFVQFVFGKPAAVSSRGYTKTSGAIHLESNASSSSWRSAGPTSGGDR